MRAHCCVRPDDRHDPAEPLRRNLAAEMQLDVAEPAGRQLDLRRVEEHPRHAEADLPVKRVVRAARQNARRAHGCSPDGVFTVTPYASICTPVTRAPCSMTTPGLTGALAESS